MMSASMTDRPSKRLPVDPQRPLPGSVLIIAAPSGAGKSSLVRALLQQEPRLQLSVSFTTRSPRPGEQPGRDYHFVSTDEFLERRAAGEFLECAHVHGNWYGTSRRWIEAQLGDGFDVLLEIDWQGARQVREVFAQTVGVFVLPPTFHDLERRLRKRGQDDDATIDKRLANARGEMAHADEFEYVIINQEFTDALDELGWIVRATRLRYARQHARYPDVFEELGAGPQIR